MPPFAIISRISNFFSDTETSNYLGPFPWVQHAGSIRRKRVTKPTAMKQEGSERLIALRKTLEDDPRSLAFVELSEELIRAGSHGEASEVAQRGLLSHPDSVAGRLALAVAEAEQDHIREALEQIKRALLIDQENPKALALMGRILLKKGLAKRAVQFLSHAVKLDPKEKEYGELLKEARTLAKGGSDEAPLPVFNADQVPDASSPWNEDEWSSRAISAEAEHTVFDPEALKKLKKKKDKQDLDDALSNLPAVGDDLGEEEPTKFVNHRKQQTGDLPPPRRAPETPPEPRGKRAKMGGSAAEYSQMMKKADAEAATNEAERRVRAEAAKMPTPPPPPVGDLNIEAAPARRPEADVRPPPKAPSVERAQAAPEPPPPDPEPESKPPKAEKPAKVEKPKKEVPPPKPPPAPNKQIGHMATRMVDEALWALLGGKGPEPDGKRPEPEAKPDRPKAKVEADAKADKGAPAAEARPGQMVVRTSERFGTWTARAVLLILCVASLWIGYAITMATKGPGPETSTEELKGVAGDLERGGLASLLAAEEKITELKRNNPDLEVLLSGAMAEVYANRWARFGRDPKMLEQAKAQLKIASAERPSVELLSAMTVLSTGAASRKAIDAELERTSAEYKDSPKIWVLRARVAALDGRTKDVPVDLYTALSINPQHRLTLLELAHWHASQGAYGTAFNFYDQIQDRYPLDVEAAIDRYVLAQITGKDPNEAQAVTNLAGLVRDEIQEVAKDEAGRAALAFAVPKLAKGDVLEGIEELSKADSAFETSAVFKTAIAGVYLAMGEWAQARDQYKDALDSDPENPEHRIGLARATLGERSGRKVVPEDEKKRLAKETPAHGVADLPFATVRFVLGSFALVKVEPDASFFPEGEYRALAKKYEGAELQKRLEAASLRALARMRSAEGKHEEAIAFLQEATKLAEDARSEYGLGLAYLAKKDWDESIRHLGNAIDKNQDDVAPRLALARAYIGKSDEAKAIQALDAIEDQGDVLVPDAQLLIARLKIDRGDYEGALLHAERLTAILPKSAAAQVVHGEALLRQKGRDTEADEAFAKALALGGKLATGEPPPGLTKLTPFALVGLGRVEMKQNVKRGLALLKQAEKAEEVPDEVHFYLGQALIQNKKTKKDGKKELERYVRLASGGELRDEAERLLKRR